MKFSCEKNDLLNLLVTASRAVTGKSSFPLLEGVLLDANGETLTVTGYNGSLGIRSTTSADIPESGKTVLSAKLLLDIIRKFPPELVYLETNDKMLTTIRCGRSVFNLVAQEADEFPDLAEVSKNTGFSLSQSVLKSMIAQTIFSVSDNESKPIHTGCLFELTPNELKVVSVDGYRLSVRQEQVDNINQNLKFVVPGASLREVERILTDEDGEVEIFPDEKNILFRVGNTTLITRLLHGEFLNYSTAIPTTFQSELIVSRQELITSVERVSLMVNEKLKTPIRFQFIDNQIILSCVTAIGKSYDECSIIDGAAIDLEIGFNNRYMLDPLRAVSDEKIKIKLNGSLNPLLITPIDNDKYTYLVLPVRLKNNA